MSTEINFKRPLAVFSSIVVLLAIVKFVVGLVLVPVSLAPVLSVVSIFFFIGLSLFGLIVGSSREWTGRDSWLFLGAGVALHLGSFLVLRSGGAAGMGQVLLRIGMDSGVLLWTLGLGTLVGRLIKEKNLLLPVAIFLAGFDMFLILTPTTPQAKIVRENPEIVGAIGTSVPGVRASTEENQKEGAKIDSVGYVGPADFFVTAALFSVMFRHRMKSRQSALWLMPVMGGYMILALVSPVGGLPALVPIGATVMIVNAREFKLSKDERQATIGVTVIALLLAGFGLFNALKGTKPIEPIEPLPMDSSAGAPELEATPN